MQLNNHLYITEILEILDQYKKPYLEDVEHYFKKNYSQEYLIETYIYLNDNLNYITKEFQKTFEKTIYQKEYQAISEATSNAIVDCMQPIWHSLNTESLALINKKLYENY